MRSIVRRDTGEDYTAFLTRLAQASGIETPTAETLTTAAEQVKAVLPERSGVKEVVADKGCHSNETLVDLAAMGVRSYIAEPDRGRRNWKDREEARDAVYGNRHRIRSERGLERPGTAVDAIPARCGVDRRAISSTPSTIHLNTEDFCLGLYRV